jgi:hypothetical protein
MPRAVDSRITSRDHEFVAVLSPAAPQSCDVPRHCSGWSTPLIGGWSDMQRPRSVNTHKKKYPRHEPSSGQRLANIRPSPGDHRDMQAHRHAQAIRRTVSRNCPVSPGCPFVHLSRGHKKSVHSVECPSIVVKRHKRTSRQTDSVLRSHAPTKSRVLSARAGRPRRRLNP